MSALNTLIDKSAARITASTFGVLAGLGGIVHGIGEVLQGNDTPDGYFIRSWAQGPIAVYMDGDPAITVIPSFLFSGIFTLLFSLTAVVWSAVFIKGRRGGAVLLLLFLAGLFVGAGVGPPVLGILAGISGLGINASYSWWRAYLHDGFRKMVAASWPWIFGISAANGVFLVIGHIIAVYFFAPVDSQLFLYSFYLAAISVIVTIICGIAYDISLEKIRT